MPAPKPARADGDRAALRLDAIALSRKAIFWWLPLLYLLVSSAFYLRTYDSAQVKITLVQMGGTCLLALWLCRLLEEGRAALSRESLLGLAPFLAFLASGIFSFIHAPYHWSSTDFFLRRVFYMTAALIVIQEFNGQAVQRLIRVLVVSTWITVGYGLLQWFDFHYFPPGLGKGVDPFIWRGAFGDRTFSTYGNPNFYADYLVIMFPILVCQWFKTRDWKLLLLIAGALFTLYGTQTKGAWIGFAISFVLLSATYLWFFDRPRLQRYRLQIGGALAGVMLLAFLAVAMKLRTNFTSVNFRLFTWEATWEMIMTKPLAGTGIGSFWVIYPAFRRPPIFHIEGKHNTETDHAEDEWLEVLFDEGIIGFGIFLWLIGTCFVVAYRALSRLTGSLKPGDRAPPRAYDLLGFLVAFQGMLAHNLFDVSMRFVSSGVYLGLLSGMIVNLSRGAALSDLHPRAPVVPPGVPGPTGAGAPAGGIPSSPAGRSLWDDAAAFLVWPMRLAAWGALLYMAHRLTGLPRTLPVSGFDELQGPLFRVTLGGERLQWWIAWTCFLGCVLGLGAVFARVVALARNPLVPAVVILMLYPLNLGWGFFRADVYHNIAIFFSKQQNWEMALRHYLKVGDLNPAYIMAFYFKGNVFLDRFSMDKVYEPKWGDLGGVARDDFERAMSAYEEVRARAPNYVQMHHQVGVLHFKKGEWHLGRAEAAAKAGREDEARREAEAGQREWDNALRRFEMYRAIDPVFAPNYYRMGHIHMMRRDYDKALATHRALLDAPQCRVKPALLARPWMRRTILAYHGYVQGEDGAWVHKHESPEAYTSVANVLLLKGDLVEAERNYKKALVLDPNYVNAQRNLQVLYQRAQQMGRLKVIPPFPAAPAQTPPTFEVVPSKK